MSPQAASEDLLYVSDSDGHVDVFSYPDGKQVGVLKGFSSPAGLCSDSKGDVYVVNTNLLNILEYKHGGKKVIATLNDFGHYPVRLLRRSEEQKRRGCELTRTRARSGKRFNLRRR